VIQYAAKPAFVNRSIAPPVARPACRTVLISRMAGDIQELAFAGRNVSVETLKQAGWSDPTIVEFFPDASAMARRQSVRQIAEAGR